MVEPQKQRREGGRGGVGRKSDKEEEMKSVAVCERNTLRERERDGGPLFIAVPRALLGICCSVFNLSVI